MTSFLGYVYNYYYVGNEANGRIRTHAAGNSGHHRAVSVAIAKSIAIEVFEEQSATHRAIQTRRAARTRAGAAAQGVATKHVATNTADASTARAFRRSPASDAVPFPGATKTGC